MQQVFIGREKELADLEELYLQERFLYQIGRAHV